jgi:hypothetical protein
MNHQTGAAGNLERRIHDAERDLFAAVGADVEEFYLDLARTRLRVRVLSHGRGPAVVLLHGVSESAAINNKKGHGSRTQLGHQVHVRGQR